VGGLATTEILRHPPGLIWAIVCAILLCGGTGMLATRKRVKKQTDMRIFPVLEIQEHALFVVEEILYFYMGIVNIVLGIIFWVLDFSYEGMPPRNANYFPVVNPLTKTQEPDLVPPKDSSSPLSADQDLILQPRRAGIFRSRKGTRESCGCWGYQVDDIPAPSATTNMGEREDNSCPNGIAESKGKNNGEVVDHPRPRWSECQCPECTMLMMPMRLAAKNLFVRCPDSPTGESRCTDSQGQEIPINSNLSALALHLGDSKLIPKLSSDLPSVPQISDNLDIKNQSAVIFIHGLFSSSLFWFDTKLVPNLSKEIKEQHRVLVPDILGCGKSPRPVDSLYSLSDQIEALEESLIKRHGLESFHLVGHSMGCIFALVLAARCPERVRSITLIAPVYTPGALAEDGKLAQLPCEAVFTFVKPFSVSVLQTHLDYHISYVLLMISIF
jgi:pimeloyl-ACP methyl ester carboxylesterase